MRRLTPSVLFLIALCVFPFMLRSQSPVITADNAGSLAMLADFGRGTLMDVLLSEDGTQLVGVSTGGITLYDAGTLAEIRFIPFTQNYMGRVRAATLVNNVATALEGDTLTVSMPSRPLDNPDLNQTVTVQVNLATGEQSLVAEPIAAEPPTEIDTSQMTETPCYTVSRGTLASGDVVYIYYATSDGFITAYDRNTGERLARGGGFISVPTDIEIAGDTLLVSGGSLQPQECALTNPGNGVRLYDAATLAETGFLPSSIGNAHLVAVDTVSERVAFARARGVDVYEGGERIAQIGGEGRFQQVFMEGVSFSGDGRLLAVSNSGRVEIFDMDDLTGEPLVVREGVTRLPFAENIGFWQNVLVEVAGTDVRLFDVATETELSVLAHPFPVTDIKIQGNVLAVLYGRTPVGETQGVMLYQLGGEGAQKLNEFTLDSVIYGTNIALNPDASLIAIAQPNGDVVPPGTVIYSTATGQQVGEARYLTTPVIFSADGTRLIGANGSALFVYGVP